MRRLAVTVAVGLTVLLLGGLLLAPMPVAGGGKDVLSRYVVCTTTLAHAFTANPNRLSVLVQNVGTLHASVGRRIAGGPFWGTTLHVGAVLSFDDYQGGLDCQMAAGSTTVEILETVN